MEYDFSTLSPHDFELLTQDLLQREYGCRLEGFKSGRDGGIDLRRCEARRMGLVVQCKHYLRSTFSKLKRSLVKAELPKIQKLAPTRYVLVTSRPLSVKEKDDLAKLLSPFCHCPEDILGAEDLNALLRKYPEIETRHFKLWVASTEVLRVVLQNDLFARSYLEAEEIKTRLSLFVPTEAVTRAMDALQAHGFCLLSGIPGIGKTTTAEMLVALLIDKGWECVCVCSNATEALRAYDPSKRQVFYYDDFLGQTSLAEKLGKNEDHELTRLIKTCGNRVKSKRLILTTRNYLLAQAIEQHELLARTDMSAGTCVVELSDYTSPVRARILVNHLWFFGVNESWCRKLVRSGAARKIVDHKNYSPRLVEAISLRTAKESPTAAAFANNAVALLDDPAELWRYAFQNQITDSARELLISFASLGDGCLVSAIRESFQAMASKGQESLNFDNEFHRALRELEGTFIVVNSSRTSQTASYHNPSVKDFMDDVFATSPSCARKVLNTATYYDQILCAATYLLRNGADTSVERRVSELLGKFYECTSAVPQQVGHEEWRQSPVKPARRLLAWRQRYHDTTCEVLKGELRRLSAKYLNIGAYHQDNAHDIALLVRLLQGDFASGAERQTINVSTVQTWLWTSLASLDDYRAMGFWVSAWEKGDAKDVARKKLQKLFINFADSHLFDLADGSLSSSHIEQEIDEVTEVAELLGVDNSELDFDEAEAARDAAVEVEDREANMMEDDWKLRQFEERAESAAVDDILDSLG